MSGTNGARTAIRAVLRSLPTAVSRPARSLIRRARSADARRLAAGVVRRVGRVGRAVPGGARLLAARWSVIATSWSTLAVSGPDGNAVRRTVLPDDTGPATQVGGLLSVRVPDPAVLLRLAASGLLAGSVRALQVQVDHAPRWLWEGAHGSVPDPGDTGPTALAWRAAGSGIDVTASWDRPAGVASALDTALRAVLRVRPWPQAGGPLPVTDRVGWLAGAATPVQGVLLDRRPVARSDGPGPLRPFSDPQPWPGPHPVWSPLGALAFPHRRRLLGEPARYRLARAAASTVQITAVLTVQDTDGRPVAVFDGSVSPESVLTASGLTRYATLQLGDDVVGVDSDAWLGLVITALATGGLVPIPTGSRGARLLSGLGIPFPETVGQVTGPDGYAWSATVSRAAGVLGDATLRRTGLAVAVGGTASHGALLPLPQLSVLVASMRPDTIGALLADLATQTYPSFEVVLGTHGWTATAEQLDRWSALLGRPLRAVARDADVPFGEVLGGLTRFADGDVLTKADDDDVYGPDHLTDLVLAWRQTGADLVAKAPRFVHLEDPTAAGPAAAPDPRGGTTGSTVDRSWAASEVFGRTPAGGTLLAARSTLLDAGGWSGSVRHVDIDLTARIRQAGGVVYRTHGLGYVYVRHARGHTWAVDHSVFLEQAGDVLPGLPGAIATGRPAGYRL